jgi:hypothetical protein
MLAYSGQIVDGRVFRSINKAGKIRGDGRLRLPLSRRPIAPILPRFGQLPDAP